MSRSRKTGAPVCVSIEVCHVRQTSIRAAGTSTPGATAPDHPPTSSPDAASHAKVWYRPCAVRAPTCGAA